MRRYRLHHQLRQLRRRLIAGVALFSYLVAVLGLPVPVLAAKSGSKPFPCQSHACGCRDAEACLKHCCCFSAEEKLSWAQAEGLEPAAAIEPQTDLSWHTPRMRDQQTNQAASKPCCKNQAPTAIANDDRCAHETHAAECGAESCERAKLTVRWHSTLSTLHCKGHGTLWVAMGAAAPPPIKLTWNPYALPTDWWHSEHVTSSSFSFPPVDPPPRSVPI